MRFLSCLHFILLFTFFTSSCSYKQEPPREVNEYLQDVSFIIQKNSLYADSLDWKELHEKIARLSKGLKTPEECRPVVDTLVNALRRAGDKHSFFISKQAIQKIKAEGVGGTALKGAFLGNGIGYIKVSSFASLNAAEASVYASKIKNQIKRIDSAHPVRAWIVDLRGNGGGTMYPMIAGLNSLTRDGLYGYFLKPKKGKDVPLFSSNGVAGMAGVDQPYKIKNLSCKIAVLIDSLTLSSGEMTAISFKSLPNVRFFGQPTGAFTTANQTYELKDGSYLVLATAFMADRNKVTYVEGIIPDVITPTGNDSMRGPTIEMAKAWLLSNHLISEDL